MTSPQQRRDFFRIDQDVLFTFRQVDVHCVEERSAEDALSDAASANLAVELRKLDREGERLLQLLGEENRLLADYLHKLNRKVDLIARHSAFATEQDPNLADRSRVNVSEGGVSFTCDRALYIGNYLAVRLVFIPESAPIYSYMRVTRCDAEGDVFHVAASFHQLREHFRQELARQLLKAQARAR